jgi:hypothetical protein
VKKLIFLGLLLNSSIALACWRLEGKFSVNGREIEINQRVDHDKTYSFARERLSFHTRISSDKKHKDVQLIEVWVEEKQGLELKELVRTKIRLKKNEMSAKKIEDQTTGLISIFNLIIKEI